VTIPAYPLTWPTGWKRMPVAERKAAKFVTKSREYSSWTDHSGQQHSTSYLRGKDVTVAAGVDRVRAELARMNLRDDDIVISTNVKLRLDGLPRSDQREPDDSGAAVYWIDKSGATRCMAIDRYTRVADNLAAIAATLDAMRAIERHGGAEILDRAFTGFTALPAPDSVDWRTVLGIVIANPSRETLDTAYRRARSESHPDRGGDAEWFQRVQDAYAAALKESAP
jgi:hypothetical protein